MHWELLWSHLRLMLADYDFLLVIILPISVPIPSTLPRIAMSADSPPELPPGVRDVLYGFVVVPYRLLTDSSAFAT